jgi:hypothetical protein
MSAARLLYTPLLFVLLPYALARLTWRARRHHFGAAPVSYTAGT